MFSKCCKILQLIITFILASNYAYAEEDTSFLRYLPSNLGYCPSYLKNVNQIYVINLDVRYEKWKKTRDELERYGLQAVRVSGVNGWAMDRDLMKDIRKDCLKWNCLSDGQLGCFLSHLTVLKDALRKRYKCIWVLEDDIVVLEDIREIDALIDKLDEFDPEWDLLFTNINNRINARMDGPMLTFEMVMGPKFNYSLMKDPDFVPKENEDFRKIQYRLGTYSMIISHRGIKKLLDYFKKEKINFPVDMQIHCCPKKRFYISKKEYIGYEKKDSDTGNVSSFEANKDKK